MIKSKKSISPPEISAKKIPFHLRLRRGLLIAGGILSVGMAVIGAILPLLPTTPFLLLAAACFVRSSPRLHHWLFHNRLFGGHLRRYVNGEGLAPVSKIVILVILWGTLAVSAFLMLPSRLWWVKLLLLAVGIGVTIHILMLKTTDKKDSQPKQ
ncbi:YbaN family protein [Candidatus Haliotispira prima]|uniref:YbaN family protein n=1 Tax=Candidatus Haliotispira prima TaxID=3034016 RepID=A0ABY8MKS5_9SPIO|nr:YbaN family protein [Candidatus Haliotispira prima]